MIAPSAGADTPVPSAITLTAPAQVERGAQVDATGTLETDPDGAPIPGAVLDWRADCVTDGFSSIASGQVSTGVDGTFAIDYAPGYCTQGRLTVTWSGAAAADHDRVSADTDIPWRVTHVEVALPAAIYLGDQAHGTVHVTVDGAPAADAPVGVSVQSALLPDGGAAYDGKTDANGDLTFPLPSSGLGWFQVFVSSRPTPESTWMSWSGEGVVDRVPTQVGLSYIGQLLVAGSTHDLTGSVARADGNVDGLQVQLWENDHDQWGWYSIGFAVTDAQGSFTLSHRFGVAGWPSFRATVPGDHSRYLDAESNVVETTVGRKSTTLEVDPDHTTYLAGHTATIKIGIFGRTLEDPYQDLRVTAVPPGPADALGTLLYSGPLYSDGQTILQTMRTSETIDAAVTPNNEFEWAEKSVVVQVREALTSASSSSFSISRSPSLFTANGSRRAGECLHFVVQKRTAGGWRTVTRSGCRSTDSSGHAAWRPRAPRRLGTAYRFRTEWAGDALDLAAHSGWVEFAFRR